MWIFCLDLTAVGGADGAFICKMIVTYYISNSYADSGATIVFHINNAVPQKTPPISKKKKEMQGYTKNISQKERRQSNSTRGYAGNVRTDNVV